MKLFFLCSHLGTVSMCGIIFHLGETNKKAYANLKHIADASTDKGVKFHC